MKTTLLTLEIKHIKPLPDDYETTIANRAYGYLYARGVEVGVRAIRGGEQEGNSSPLSIEMLDGQQREVGEGAGVESGAELRKVVA